MLALIIATVGDEQNDITGLCFSEEEKSFCQRVIDSRPVLSTHNFLFCVPNVVLQCIRIASETICWKQSFLKNSVSYENAGRNLHNKIPPGVFVGYGVFQDRK